jgi:ketosteroid isomerase-like protein
MEHANPEDAVLAQARKDFDRWAGGDTEGYGESAADDVTYFHNVPAHPRVDGIQAFREYLASLRGQILPHRYEIVDPKIQVYGSVGILTLHYHAFSSEGESLARARGTCVYRKANGAWEMVHTHWSGLEEA